MDHNRSSGQCELIDKVINQGICVTCGACVGLCPYFDYFDGKVVVMDRCHSDTWRCLQLCPMVDCDDTSLNMITGHTDQAAPIGPFEKIFIARAKEKEIREKAQYGGSVSALIIYAMEKGLIKSAVLTDKGKENSPSGFIAREKSEVLNFAGSRYTASAALAALNIAIKENKKELAVVGLPCQMEALARMKLMKPDGEQKSGCINLKIGLFCTWAVDYRKLDKYLRSIGIKKPVSKYDIPPPPSQIFQVMTKQGLSEISLDHIRPFIQEGCSLCRDMTAEWADISVGTVEGQEGWNTVVVRSNTGTDLISDAIEDNILEIDQVSEKNLEHLKRASLDKRKRGDLAREGLRRKTA